jgi:hypothetical protein
MPRLIDVTYMREPLYWRLTRISDKISDKVFQLYEEMLTPHGFLDKMCFYSDGRSKKMKILKSVIQNKSEGINALEFASAKSVIDDINKGEDYESIIEKNLVRAGKESKRL